MKSKVYKILLFACFSFSCSIKTEKLSTYKNGSEVYIAHCISCHGEDGKGFNGIYPPLQNRTIDEQSIQRGIQLISNGSFSMKAISLTDREIADVMNFINNSWGQKSDTLSLKDVENYLKN